mmetsp:Transcript_4258/g.4795  ORF Transcript_4258/g.4795 Transcript_4258/m.4795 type:complete len:88 (-) Transcript_4258:151-414(-)
MRHIGVDHFFSINTIRWIDRLVKTKQTSTSLRYDDEQLRSCLQGLQQHYRPRRRAMIAVETMPYYPDLNNHSYITWVQQSNNQSISY